MGITKIEWTSTVRADGTVVPGYTYNPWRGCTKISDGCKNCYAEAMSKRNPTTLGIWGDNGTRVIASESYWKQPLRWNYEAMVYGERRRVFCASLADVFEDRLELIEPRRRLFDIINQTPNLDWLLLTKRPENIERLFDDVRRHFNWDEDLSVMNVWLGTTVENQDQADKRIPELLKVPAAVRFLSCEPLLSAVNLEEWLCDLPEDDDGAPYPGNGIQWVIAGGESGPNARPAHPDWFRSLRDQCQAASVPFFFKQWGGYFPVEQWEYDPELILTEDQANSEFAKVGKKAAGRLLDGRTWDELPIQP